MHKAEEVDACPARPKKPAAQVDPAHVAAAALVLPSEPNWPEAHLVPLQKVLPGEVE
jgi:hypothetical protein